MTALFVIFDTPSIMSKKTIQREPRIVFSRPGAVKNITASGSSNIEQYAMHKR